MTQHEFLELPPLMSTHGIVRLPGSKSISNRVLLLAALALIVSHVCTQAFISAVCDDFFVASMITIAALIPILFIRVRRRSTSEHISSLK